MRRIIAPLFVSVLLFVASLAAGCNQPTSPSEPLSPARSLAGTWSTAAPVTFTYRTDFCGGLFRDVGRAEWNVTWEITAATGFTNVIDIEMRFTRGATTPIGTCQPSGWVPPISPIDMRQCITSSRFVRCENESYEGGEAYGSFTTDLIQATFDHFECIIYCSGEYTAENALKLVRRS